MEWSHMNEKKRKTTVNGKGRTLDLTTSAVPFRYSFAMVVTSALVQPLTLMFARNVPNHHDISNFYSPETTFTFVKCKSALIL